MFMLLLLSVCSISDATEKILYSHPTNDYWQVWMMDADGGDKEQITFSPSDKRDPTWMQGPEIVFRNNNGELYLIDIEAREERRVLPNYINAHGLSYSSKLGKMVFVSLSISPFETGEIWQTDIDGQNGRLLTQDKRFKFQPSFSPSGDKIIFVKSEEDRKMHHIWMMNSDGTNQEQLSFDKAREATPDFSPDEKWIVFSSNRENNNYDIYLMNLKNKAIKKLVESSALDTSPRFFPDGEKVIFVSSRTGNQQIWSIDIDGANLQQLTDTPGESIDAGWMTVGEELKDAR